VSDVQGWIDNPGTNTGWLLKASEEAVWHTARRFFTREASALNRPTLRIEYTIIPAPGAGAVLLGMLAVTVRRRRRV
jgi:hypothetical protein